MAKKWGILIKKESESLIFTGLKIPRDYSFEQGEKLLDMVDSLDKITEYVEEFNEIS